MCSLNLNIITRQYLLYKLIVRSHAITLNQLRKCNKHPVLRMYCVITV